jgi:hypothetical protein
LPSSSGVVGPELGPVVGDDGQAEHVQHGIRVRDPSLEIVVVYQDLDLGLLGLVLQ